MEEANVKGVIQRFFEAIDRQDMEQMERLIAHDAEMVHFGTDADERWVGWEDLKSSTEDMFETLESYTVSIRNLLIRLGPSAQVAWFSLVMDSVVETRAEEVRTEDQRLTGVLEKRNGRWVFVQSHLSVPVSGQVVAY